VCVCVCARMGMAPNIDCSLVSRQTVLITSRHQPLTASGTAIIKDSEAIFSQRELTFTFAICCRPSVCLPSVVCLSVTLVHPTQAVVISSNILRHLVRWPSNDIHEKFYGDRPRRTPPSGELNTTGVAKYCDFGPIESYLGNGAR